MTRQSMSSYEPNRALFLDGIRGWASLMVVLSHFLVYFFANSIPAYKNWIFGFLSDGNLAVFIFFVLSGFALSIGYIQTGKLKIVTALAIRRYTRLTIPILGACLLAYTLQKFHLFSNVEAGKFSSNQWLVSFYNFPPDLLSCIKFSLYDVFVNYDEVGSYNAVLWTMPIEFFGSFVVLSICALILHLRARLFLLAVILAYLMATKNVGFQPFICGIGIAIYFHHPDPKFDRLLKHVCPTLILLAAYYSSSSLRGGLFGLPAIPRSDIFSISAATIIVLAATFDATLKGFFESPISRYLGSISFPLYLTHFLVLCSFSSFMMTHLPKLGLAQESSHHLNLWASLALCIFIAHCFRQVEYFAIGFSRRISTILMEHSFISAH